MSRQSENVKRWRHNTKSRLVEAFGGSCCICGYDRCDEALDFHHLDPTEKDFSFGSIRGSIRGWKTIVNEIRKCVLVCTNCHREIHSKRCCTEVPEDALRFNEVFADYKSLTRQELMDDCPICGKKKLKHLITCSKSCAAKRSYSVDWKNVDVVLLVNKHKTYVSVAEVLGISASAVRKRYLKVLSLSPL